MRNEIDIYRAHDILCAIVNQEVPHEFADDTSRIGLIAALDALCWVLGHDAPPHGCNVTFGNNLARIEADLAKRGFHLHRKNN